MSMQLYSTTLTEVERQTFNKSIQLYQRVIRFYEENFELDKSYHCDRGTRSIQFLADRITKIMLERYREKTFQLIKDDSVLTCYFDEKMIELKIGHTSESISPPPFVLDNSPPTSIAPLVCRLEQAADQTLSASNQC